MKIAFLDIDGVLNSDRYFASALRLKKGTYVLDPICCGIFCEWADKYDVTVVLSSTWRLHDDHFHFLEQAGILDRQHPTDPRTPSFGGYAKRPDEIDDWLARHPETTSYVIFDDHADNRYDEHPHQVPRFVHTNEVIGLTKADIMKASEIISTPLGA